MCLLSAPIQSLLRGDPEEITCTMRIPYWRLQSLQQRFAHDKMLITGAERKIQKIQCKLVIEIEKD